MFISQYISIGEFLRANNVTFLNLYIPLRPLSTVRLPPHSFRVFHLRVSPRRTIHVLMRRGNSLPLFFTLWVQTIA